MKDLAFKQPKIGLLPGGRADYETPGDNGFGFRPPREIPEARTML